MKKSTNTNMFKRIASLGVALAAVVSLHTPAHAEEVKENDTQPAIVAADADLEKANEEFRLAYQCLADGNFREALSHFEYCRDNSNIPVEGEIGSCRYAIANELIGSNPLDREAAEIYLSLGERFDCEKRLRI